MKIKNVAKKVLFLFLLSPLSGTSYASGVYKCTVEGSYSMFREDDRTVVDGLLHNKSVNNKKAINFIIDTDTGRFLDSNVNVNVITGNMLKDIVYQGYKGRYFKGHYVDNSPGSEVLTVLEIQYSYNKNPFLLYSGFKVYTGLCNNH